MISRPDPRRVWRALARNWPLKLFSLVFAAWLWAFVNLGERDAEKTLVVPLELRNLPPDLLVTSSVVDSVDVRVKGPRTLLGTLVDRDEGIQLDLGNVRTGRTSFRIDSEMLSLPRAVRIVRLSPAQVLLDIERMVDRELPVIVDFADAVPLGYHVVETEIQPRAVHVTGPANQVDGWKNVKTQPVYLAPSAGVFEKSVGLRNPGELSRFTPERVNLRVRLDENVVAEEFENLDIQVRNAGGPYRLRQRRAGVTVRGPERQLRELKLGGVQPFIDASGLAPGTHKAEIQVSLPRGLEVTAIRPEQVALQIQAAPGRARR